MLDASQVERMSVAERLQAIEQLWDAVCRESPNLSSPKWHRNVLADRKARAKRGDAKFLSMAEVRNRLLKPKT